MYRSSRLVCAAAVMTLATAGFGDGMDPAFSETGLNRARTLWCASSGLAADTLLGPQLWSTH